MQVFYWYLVLSFNHQVLTFIFPTQQPKHRSIPLPTLLHFKSYPKPWPSSSLYSSSQEPPPPLPDTKDPFILLGLSTPTADAKEIKRAYKRMALRYHPDVRINTLSTPEEKKLANNDFARINDAYNRLTSTTTNNNETNRGPSTTDASFYKPPHRRTATTTTTADTNKKNTWENFVPPLEDYNTNGDSLEAIFTDLFSTIAGGAAGVVAEGVRKGKEQKSGILYDFIEFLEENLNISYDMPSSSSSSSWKDKDILFETETTIQDVSLEMEDTTLLISQLERKQMSIEEEIQILQADVDKSIRLIEKMEIQERLDELLARKKIVMGYLKKSRDRYGALQQKYKEMTLQARAYGRRHTVSSKSSSSKSYHPADKEDNIQSTTTTYPTNSMGTAEPSYRYNNSLSNGDTTSSSRQQSTVSDGGDSSSSSSNSSTRKREGFGSFGRKYNNRASRPPQQARDVSKPFTENNTSRDADTANEPVSTSPQPPQQMWNSKNENTSISSDPIIIPVPPHRRMTGSTSIGNSNSRGANIDKKRLRDLKVDEDFSKLKREMGL